MFTRQEIVDFSVKKWCKRELSTKGMVTALSGDVICIATLSGDYPDEVCYLHYQESPKEVRYCGVYGVGAQHRLDPNNHETRKNIAVTKTDGKKKFVYLFEKTELYSDEYFFHGRYKYKDHEFIQSSNPDHEGDEILFHLLFIDIPSI
jgi:hypothetical protein